MRILFILEYYHPHIGGLETLFKSLIDSLTKQGHQITILTNQYDKNLPAKETSGSLVIKRYPFINRYLFTLLAFFPALKLAFSHDLIHTTSYNAALPAFWAGKLSGRRVVVTFHEVWGDLWMQLPFFSKWKLKLHQYFERLLLNLSFYRFIAVSEATKESLIDAGVTPTRIEMIYNGIDYSMFETRDTIRSKSHTIEPFRFIYFGRLGISKGLDVLMPALQLLKQENPAFHMTLVIPRKPTNLFNWVLELTIGLGENLTLKHDLEKSELLNLIRHSHAVIIPSYSEGFCFTAVESMALDIPIVSSQRGALKEVVGGKYIDFDSMSASSLVDALLRAINNQWEFRPKRKFALAASVEHYLQFYQKVLTK